MNVSITNQQRSHAMDLSKLRPMMEKLAQAFCQNISSQTPLHSSQSETNAICQKASLSIVFTSNRKIRQLNKQWRNKDYDTDVLSFPLDMQPPPAGIPWELGEIYISVEKAIEQAKSYNHSLDRELAFLCIHGMLHIIGFDHEEPDEEKEMFRRQRAILKAAGYPRDAAERTLSQ
jgi:probable rRNA maturation factor